MKTLETSFEKSRKATVCAVGEVYSERRDRKSIKKNRRANYFRVSWFGIKVGKKVLVAIEICTFFAQLISYKHPRTFLGKILGINNNNVTVEYPRRFWS